MKNIFTMIFISILSSCGNQDKEKEYSFKITFFNRSDYQLTIGYSHSASTDCSTPAESMLVDSQQSEQVEFTSKCTSSPDHQVLSIQDSLGNGLASFQFALNDFHVECDNEKCTNTVGDFAGTDAAIKTFRFPLGQ